jgi:GNAT superfamily N-acetyltransferase
MSLSARAMRTADLDRIEELIAGMFRDLGTVSAGSGWQPALRHALVTRADVAAFITIDDADRPVAVAVGVVDRRLPSPRRPDGRIGYVEWLATDPAFRRRGAARSAMVALLGWFAGRGIGTIDVHASAAARSLYEQLGFAPPAATPMRRA